MSRARAVAGRDAEFILFEVLPDADPLFGLLGNLLLTAEQIQRASADGVGQELERVRQGWIQICPNVEIEVATGDSSDEILAAAERRRADLIVMATHGRGGLDRWIIGSVADRVARTSPVPVLLVHPRDAISSEPGARSIARLVVPLDGSDLAAHALPFAARIAASLDIPVLLVAVSDLPREMPILRMYGSAFSQQIQDELLAEGRRAADQTLADAAASLRGMGVAVSRKLLDGPVAAGIAGAAGQDDVIVMTSHGHGGIRRLFLGSVAHQLINHGRLAVILVPPVDRDGQAGDGTSA